MSKLKLEEKEILEAFEAGRLKRVKNADKEIDEHRIVAEETFKKDARIIFGCRRRTSGRFRRVL